MASREDIGARRIDYPISAGFPSSHLDGTEKGDTGLFQGDYIPCKRDGNRA